MWTLDAGQCASVVGLAAPPAIRVGTTHATASPQNIVTGDVMMPTAYGDESLAEDDVVVAAGERR